MTTERRDRRDAEEPPRRTIRVPSRLSVRVAMVAYGINGLVALALGGVYVASSRFLPYHEEAIGQQWESLNTDTQALFRALVHFGGGGLLAGGATFLVLALIPLRRGERWAAAALPIISLLFWLPTLWATVEVTARTDATAPWYGSAAALVATVVGLVASITDQAQR